MIRTGLRGCCKVFRHAGIRALEEDRDILHRILSDMAVMGRTNRRLGGDRQADPLILQAFRGRRGPLFMRIKRV